ncbi:hypothetical protein JG687_00008730 [Phytophthora cactorum]|uniref:Uncharacterized protein n=2 Tax=Phytophthora cactorum TaxID=29920 RepID=A0A8T1UBK2_9STRA|nr:hypothetical protein JG687_00008730 [Phytophthora cactorum]
MNIKLDEAEHEMKLTGDKFKKTSNSSAAGSCHFESLSALHCTDQETRTMRTSLTLALAAILCTLLSVPIVQAEEGRLQIGQIKPTNRRAEETEEKFVKASLPKIQHAGH